MAAVQTWRYNIAAAAKPVTDRDNGQQPGRGCGTSGGVGAAPGAQEEARRFDMETWDAIGSRRNVRSYGERAIAPQELDRILEAARRAPSAGNQQAWDFVVCTDREQLAQLARAGPAAGHVAGSAATIALVAPMSDDPELARPDPVRPGPGDDEHHAGRRRPRHRQRPCRRPRPGAGAAPAGCSRGPVLRPC